MLFYFLPSHLSSNNDFTIESIVMKDRSIILLPSSYRNRKISIENISIEGNAYVYVYQMEEPITGTRGWDMGQAGYCANGDKGHKGGKGFVGEKTGELIFNLGVSKLSGKLIILAKGYPGGRGGDGGDGQAGGGASCNGGCGGGNGGEAGEPGNGGDGSKGWDIVLNYSGIDADKIFNTTTKFFNFDHSLWLDLQSVVLREKKFSEIGKEKTQIGLGFSTFKNMLDSEMNRVKAAREFSLKVGVPLFDNPSIDSLTKPGITVINPGGPPGPAGTPGNPGKKGGGEHCWIISNKGPGAPGINLRVNSAGFGAFGEAGKFVANKTDIKNLQQN